MFGIGSTEFVVFLVIILIAVGPDRLPAFMRTVGKGLRQVRKASREFRDAVGLDELLREDPFRPPRVKPPNRLPVPLEKASAAKKADDSQTSAVPGPAAPTEGAAEPATESAPKPADPDEAAGANPS